ncbi:S1C family serine protease [Papillibacter cinnamivorans]|uniref:Serine protease Do n=1 Tax=Papillibacter cinnamivorans DSM 12816 TaxID=1122930 RepID=A0A1W2CRI9_9FIRM|nr:trypsin-like peptidase domain-containing protein [Papillibacter cinnamivorans]SMC87586.1 serine protease Do [Papillibacter cinnamivorans DSM 12816]
MQYNYNGDNLYENKWISEFSEQSGQADQPSGNEPVSSGKKKRKGPVKLIALCLVCILLGGAGGGIGVTLARGGNVTEIVKSSREVTQVDTESVTAGQELTDAQIYAKYAGSTVGISTESSATNVFGQTTSIASSGSGFIITADGYIVTNHHVIEDATSVTVTLYDGSSYKATVVGYDSDADIAVLKVDATGLTPVVIGNSDTLSVGESVAAIGNPLGELTYTMTAGIVSALDREINIDGTPYDMLQIDAAVNPGNSGGPLFNSYGEVVGIVSAKYSDTDIEGIGFAIPINDVVSLVTEIMENGYVTGKPTMGITATTMSADTAKQYNMVEGAYVYTVESGSCAEKAGLKSGDIITAMDDTQITSLSDLISAKKAHKAGDTVTLTVYRGGSSLQLQLTFDEEKPETSTSSSTTSGSSGYGSRSGGIWGSSIPYGNSGDAA